MSLPVNIDDYSRYVTLTDDELHEELVSMATIERVHRLRGMYAYWLQFPTKFDKEIVEFDMNMNKVSRSQAYDDLRLVQLLLGNLQMASKNFIRWKINKDLEEDLKNARLAGDYRSVAAIEKNRILNNRTDKEDEIEFEYDKIIPQTFEPTDDPTTLGIEKVPDLRGRIRKLIARYSKDIAPVEDAQYEEIDGETEQ